MKIDWSKAPEWARWAAMDSDGTWWWFENKPFHDGTEWLAHGEFTQAFTLSLMQERPQ